MSMRLSTNDMNGANNAYGEHEAPDMHGEHEASRGTETSYYFTPLTCKAKLEWSTGPLKNVVFNDNVKIIEHQGSRHWKAPSVVLL